MHEEFFTEDLLQRSLHVQVIGGRTLPSQAITTSLPTRVWEGNSLPATAPHRAPGRPRLGAGLPSPAAGLPGRLACRSRKVTGAGANLPPGGISQRQGRARSRPLLQLPP